MGEDSTYIPPPLPPVKQPKGLAYYIGTWSGRIILINTIVFVLISMKSGSVWMPDTQTLLLFGAKDPVLIAKGELWRLVTPMFIHIGIIHFAVNTFMLYIIGFQLETLLGSKWFVAVYFLSGIAASIASSVFSLQLSAGASGAIFGLLGCGFFLEYTVGKKILAATGTKPKNRVYASTVLLNLAFGFMVPFIDNAAHIGGLVMGLGLTAAMVQIRPNRLQTSKPWIGYTIMAAIVLAVGAGTVVTKSQDLLLNRLIKATQEVDDRRQKLVYLTQAIDLDPANKDLLLQRARILMLAGESQYALYDLRLVLEDQAYIDRVKLLATELEMVGLAPAAWQIRRLIDHSNNNQKNSNQSQPKTQD